MATKKFIIEVEEGEIVTITGTDGICLPDENGNYHLIKDLEGCEAMPEYWEKLKHQYAGMAMQGMVKTYEQMMRADIECKMDCCEYVDAEVANGVLRSHAEACAEFCAEFATALVNKLKEESK